jgi:2-amino-4-hydroxy-6-hydroxymethyldihydropteridine diphosphokinase
MPGVGGAQSADASRPYLNAAAVIETGLPARTLLEHLLEIERRRGRIRAPGGRWGARTLDLDILLFGNDVINEEQLTIPHPRLHERLFALRPLAEIAPEMIVPATGATVRELLRRIDV